MWLLTHLKGLYNNLSYQKKLLYSYLLLLFIPLLILCLYFYIHTTRIVKKNTETLATLHMEYTTDIISDAFSEMLGLAKTVSISDTIRDTLEQENSASSVIHSKNLEEMELSLNRVHYDTSIYSIRLFVDSQLPYSQREVFTWSLDRIPELYPGMESLIRQAPTLLGPYTVTHPLLVKEEVFSFMLPIESHSDSEKLIAIACVDMKQQHLLELIKTCDFSKMGNVYLTDTKGKALVGYSNSSNSILSGTDLPSFEVTDQLLQFQENGNHICISPSILNTYHLVLVAPTKHLSQSNSLLPQLLILGIIIGVTVYKVASYYSRSNARRIIHLSKMAKLVQNGQLHVNCIVDSPDELGELQISFNEMIKKMQDMLNYQYQLGKNLKSQELKLLQAQIDPHFLYNTLDLIIWTAQNKSADEVCEIAHNLSKYYRISLSNGQVNIPIEEEIEHVRLYVSLQNMRFQNKITLETHISEEARNISVPKLLLQPLVENSIVHGFNGIHETILIDVRRENKTYCITITDDGSGISPDQLARLRLHQELMGTNDNEDHYGLSNIQERIQNFYGSGAHMTFSSVVSEGTTIKIVFPATAVH